MIIIFGLYYFIFTLFLLTFYHSRFSRDIVVLNSNPHLYIVIFVVTFFIFMVADYLYLRVIKNNHTFLGVGMTSIYPIITMLAGYVFLNEPFSYTHLAGLFVIVLGVVLLAHG